MKTKKVTLIALVVLFIGLSAAGYVALSNKKPVTAKESFTTYGACSCPPSENDVPETIDIHDKQEYDRIKAKDASDKQNCNPAAGCSLGHSVTYRYY